MSAGSRKALNSERRSRGRLSSPRGRVVSVWRDRRSRYKAIDFFERGYRAYRLADRAHVPFSTVMFENMESAHARVTWTRVSRMSVARTHA